MRFAQQNRTGQPWDKPGHDFDLGYYDYAWWGKLDEAGCRIVTRFKSNTPLIDAKSQAAPGEEAY